MCLGKDSLSDLLRFCGEDLEASELVTVLEIQIDNKLNFENYIKSLCSKASQKLRSLQRISNLLYMQKKNLLFNFIIKSQFSYFPLVWMFCSRRSNSLVKRAHSLWLATYARKLKVPGTSPAVSYVQRLGLFTNRPANV